MWNPSEDGVTHINVYSKGKTLLGQWLSNFSRSPFVHPVDGPFESIEGYWYWLSATEGTRDQLRRAAGIAAKELGRQLRAEDWPSSAGFQAKIREAIRLKLAGNERMLNLLRRSTLPLTHYYVYGGKAREVEGSEWIIDEIEKIRRGE